MVALNLAGEDIEVGSVSFEILSKDGPDLSEPLLRLPSTWAYFAAKLERIRMQRQACEAESKRLESDLYLSMRGDAGPDGKALTESGIKAKLAVHPDLIEAAGLIRTAEREERELFVLLEAIRYRKDTLTAILSARKAESFMPATPVRGTVPREAKRKAKFRGRKT